MGRANGTKKRRTVLLEDSDLGLGNPISRDVAEATLVDLSCSFDPILLVTEGDSVGIAERTTKEAQNVRGQPLYTRGNFEQV